MSDIMEWVSQYSKQFNKFNKDVLINIRKNDDIAKYVDETWREVEKCIPNEFQYLGYHYDDSDSRYKELNKEDEKKSNNKKDNHRVISILETYARLAVFRFKISAKDRQTKSIVTRMVNVPLYIPLYIDNYHFYIKGNRYSAPYQLTDSITYTNTSDILVLKTMTRAIKMIKKKQLITDIHGNKYYSHVFNIYITSKNIPFLLYYFAHFGVATTIKYFGAEDFIKFYRNPPPDPIEDLIFFKFCSLSLGVNRKEFEKNHILRQFVATMLSCVKPKNNMDQEVIENVSRWKMILGNSLSNSVSTYEKGEGYLRTFITALDHRTIINIEKTIGGFPKESMFSVVRWMFFDFNTLISKTSVLENKRLRLGEYLVTPLVRTVYAKLHRFLGTSEKNRDIERCHDILKISPGLIAGAISGKNRNNAMSLNIAKYSSYVNDDAVLTVATKYTKAGPGSPVEKSGKMIPNEFRMFDPSYVGRICILTSPNSEPGLSGVLSPFAKVNLDTLTFK